MKLLHTSDWHLGRTALGKPRTDDFDAVLREIIGIARDSEPDVILHTGDLFDASRPAVTDMRQGINALQALARVAPVVVLAGNHDSPALFRLFALIANGLSAGDVPAGAGRIHFIDQAHTPDLGGILDLPARREQRMRLASLPFVHANRFLDAFRSPLSATRDYADHLRDVQAELHRGLLDGYRPEDDVLVFAAHLYIEGALPSRSERQIELTETYATAAAALPPVAYAALGHIHRPQAVARTGFPTHYAGSPLQLDFGEVGETKSLVVVTAEPSRPAHPELVPLTAGRPLREISGSLDDLARLAERIGTAIVKVIVDTEQPTPHLAERVAELLPDAMVVRVEERCAATRVEALDRSADDGREEPDLTDLFHDYLARIGTRGAAAQHVLDSFTDLLAEASAADTPADCAALPEEDLLTSVLTGNPVPDRVRDRLLTAVASQPAPPQESASEQPATLRQRGQSRRRRPASTSRSDAPTAGSSEVIPCDL
jgi:exonuclease SbcD